MKAAREVRRRDGVPVFDYRMDAVTPPAAVLRFAPGVVPEFGPHIHDFPVLWYDDDLGVVYVVAAGAVIDVDNAIHVARGAGVFFDPAAVDAAGRSPWPAWRAHPLLFPFLHGDSGGLLRLEVPPERRARWTAGITGIESELAQRREGYRSAVAAHLTLLLIELARLAADVGGELRRNGEPLLAEVFEVIDARLAEPLSLRDVAAAVGVTPGHLTTVVRRRTGRTVGEWITERRMAEARRLLADTDLPVAVVGRRVGIDDPGYFTRVFRRTHGSSPRAWRGGGNG
ncbi:helix-turn-helix transcriptional regulator [Nocardia stercoris]|uniref:AraC family transcriptional regulator n=1 Tax=Nocardia stercoris TaxID=2483361 RepID=A0A3M2L688_9NOCA|nr:AraC family transcriptional regulator [Nocardia stercoris]RMI32854.1 AraC family transcriptional regulator [Nocardia stercoris]